MQKKHISLLITDMIAHFYPKSSVINKNIFVNDLSDDYKS